MIAARFERKNPVNADLRNDPRSVYKDAFRSPWNYFFWWDVPNDVLDFESNQESKRFFAAVAGVVVKWFGVVK